MKMKTILCRYQHWGNEGIQWTKWFNHSCSEHPEIEIKNLKEKTKEIDRITKLKHEYKIEEI